MDVLERFVPGFERGDFVDTILELSARARRTASVAGAARGVARQLVVFMGRPGGQSQCSPGISAGPG
ncbi:hypothetical protein ACH47Z_05450 [Streptomyces sp. NPDC020192]|uniref:hypothetical protein n=1 Tax=Streptomyces sp. NPDC020192 TaxID=3365066 RepID=UPI0037B0CB6A